MVNIKKLKKFWSSKKVFITGHTGFKGSWMIVALNMLNVNIYGYSLKPDKISLFNQINGKKIVKKNFFFDINDFKKLSNKISQVKPDILFHLAAQPLVSESFIKPTETFRTNIIGTLNVLEILKKNKSIKSAVIITTDKVYKIKNLNKSYTENDELWGKDPYSASKVCAEILTASYINSFFKNTHLKNRVSTARSGNVIGGGDYSKNRLVPDIIKSINNRKRLLLRNPNHIRPWQHVIEPTVGYLMLAQKQYEKKLTKTNPNWNFGPNKSSFVKVIIVLNKIIMITDYKEMTREELEVLTDQLRVERNSLVLELERLKEELDWEKVNKKAK